MRFGMVGVVLAAGLLVQQPATAETYSRCAKAKRAELEMAQVQRKSRQRRALFQWAVKECGNFDTYQKTEAAPPKPRERSKRRR